MGQRTLTIINEKSLINKVNKVGNEVFFLYSQWGIGKIIWEDLLEYYFTNKSRVKNDDIKIKFPQRTHDFTKYVLELLSKTKETIVFSKATALTVFKNEWVDNNNGGLYVEVYRDKYEYIESVKVWVILGSEDTSEGEKPYKAISFDRWCSRNSRYCTDDWKEPVRQLLKFYNFKFMKK